MMDLMATQRLTALKKAYAYHSLTSTDTNVRPFTSLQIGKPESSACTFMYIHTRAEKIRTSVNPSNPMWSCSRYAIFTYILYCSHCGALYWVHEISRGLNIYWVTWDVGYVFQSWPGCDFSFLCCVGQRPATKMSYVRVDWGCEDTYRSWIRCQAVQRRSDLMAIHLSVNTCSIT